jgi:hypothetical protein
MDTGARLALLGIILPLLICTNNTENCVNIKKYDVSNVSVLSIFTIVFTKSGYRHRYRHEILSKSFVYPHRYRWLIHVRIISLTMCVCRYRYRYQNLFFDAHRYRYRLRSLPRGLSNPFSEYYRYRYRCIVVQFCSASGSGMEPY